MSLSGMRTTGPSCDCGCRVFRDDFNRADQKINGVVGDWSGIPNRASSTHPDQFWTIRSHQMVSPAWNGTHIITFLTVSESVAPPSGPYKLIWQGVPPRHLKTSVDARIPHKNSKMRIVYQATGDDPENDKRYGAEIQTSDKRHGDEGENTACGFLRLWDLTDLDSPVLLDEGRVPGMCGDPRDAEGIGHPYRLTLCYNPDTQVLNGSVSFPTLGTHHVHAFDQPTPPDPLSSDTQIWLELVDLPPLPGFTGPAPAYAFDNFEVREALKKGNYYYYYYGGKNACPCCGAAGCQILHFTFDDAVIDCSWFTDGADIGTDYAGIYATLSAGGSFMELVRSWSGVNSECEPDKTMAVSANVRIHGGNKTLRIEMTDGPYVLVTTESGLGAGDGSIVLYNSDDTLVDDNSELSLPADSWFGVALCYYDGYIVASAPGHTIEGQGSDTIPKYAKFTNTSSVDIDLDEIFIVHDLYAGSCPDCFGDGLPGSAGPTDGGTQTVDCPDFMCLSGSVPNSLKVTIVKSHCAYQDDGLGGLIDHSLNATNLFAFDRSYCAPEIFNQCFTPPGPDYSALQIDQGVTWIGFIHGPHEIVNGSVYAIIGTVTEPCGPLPSCANLPAIDDPSKKNQSFVPVGQVFLGKKDGSNKVWLLITVFSDAVNCLGNAFVLFEGDVPPGVVDCVALFNDDIHLRYVESFVCCDNGPGHEGRAVGADEFCLWSNMSVIISR